MITVVSLLATALLIFIDQITKSWASATLSDGTVIPIIRDIFVLQYTENRGVGFSLLQNQRWLFIPISLLIALALVVVLFRSPLRRRPMFSTVCVLLLSGAVGNLIDRIYLGYVIDFLYFELIDFPIFNFADCCVVVGAILMCVYILFGAKDLENLPLRTVLFGISAPQKEDDHG